MTSQFPRDPAVSIEIVSELNRVGRELREAYMQSRRDELLSAFESYLQSRQSISNPKFNVVLFGFQEAWRRNDFDVIVRVGDKLPREWLLRWREPQAFYAMALARVGRDMLRLA